MYQTDFFETLKIDIVGSQLVINVKENKIIQRVSVEGIKSKNLKESILDKTYSKDKSSFLISKVKEDVDKIKNSLNEVGYYFADVNVKTSDKNGYSPVLYIDNYTRHIFKRNQVERNMVCFVRIKRNHLLN